MVRAERNEERKKFGRSWWNGNQSREKGAIEGERKGILQSDNTSSSAAKRMISVGSNSVVYHVSTPRSA